MKNKKIITNVLSVIVLTLMIALISYRLYMDKYDPNAYLGSIVIQRSDKSITDVFLIIGSKIDNNGWFKDLHGDYRKISKDAEVITVTRQNKEVLLSNYEYHQTEESKNMTYEKYVKSFNSLRLDLTTK